MSNIFEKLKAIVTDQAPDESDFKDLEKQIDTIEAKNISADDKFNQIAQAASEGLTKATADWAERAPAGGPQDWAAEGIGDDELGISGNPYAAVSDYNVSVAAVIARVTVAAHAASPDVALAGLEALQNQLGGGFDAALAVAQERAKTPKQKAAEAAQRAAEEAADKAADKAARTTIVSNPGGQDNGSTGQSVTIYQSGDPRVTGKQAVDAIGAIPVKPENFDLIVKSTLVAIRAMNRDDEGMSEQVYRDISVSEQTRMWTIEAESSSELSNLIVNLNSVLKKGDPHPQNPEVTLDMLQQIKSQAEECRDRGKIGGLDALSDIIDDYQDKVDKMNAAPPPAQAKSSNALQAVIDSLAPGKPVPDFDTLASQARDALQLLSTQVTSEGQNIDPVLQAQTTLVVDNVLDSAMAASRKGEDPKAIAAKLQEFFDAGDALIGQDPAAQAAINQYRQSAAAIVR